MILGACQVMKRPAKQNVGFPMTTVSVLCCCPVLKPWKWKRRILFQAWLGSANPWWYYLGPRYMVTTKAENPPTKCTTYSEQKTNFKKTNFWEIEKSWINYPTAIVNSSKLLQPAVLTEEPRSRDGIDDHVEDRVHQEGLEVHPGDA